MLLAALMTGVMTCAIVPLEARGQQLGLVWSQRDRPAGQFEVAEEAVALAYWDDPNPSQGQPNRVLYVTGWGTNPLTGATFIATYKYDVLGEDEAARRALEPVYFPSIDPPAGTTHKPAAMVIDPTSGDVYIVGQATNPGQGRTDTDYIILKYDKDLVPAGGWEPQAPWTEHDGVRRYDGPAGSDDRAVDATFVSIHNDKRLYVTGTSYGGATGNDIVTLRIAPESGHEMWAHRYDAVDIYIGTWTAAYVAGWAFDPNTDPTHLVLKYSFPSQAGLIAAHGLPSQHEHRPRKLDVQIDGEVPAVYVTGRGGSFDFGLDYVTIRLNP